MNLSKLRRGSTFNEVIVAAVLLLAGIGLLARGTAGSKQLWQDTQHYQLALDELSNQLERIAALEPAERQAAIDSLAASPSLQHVLPSAQLSVESRNDDDGYRLIMSLKSADDRRLPTVSLVGWLPVEAAPVPAKATQSPAGDTL